MLKEHAKAVRRSVITVDLFVVVSSFFAASWLVGFPSHGELVRHHGLLLASASVVWILCLRWAGFYGSIRTREYGRQMMKVVQATAAATVMNAALIFLVSPDFSRTVFVTHTFVAVALLMGWKSAVVAGQHLVRRGGYNFRRVLVVGTREPAMRVIRHLEAHRHWGFQVVGCVQGNRSPELKAFCGSLVLGRVEDLLAVCKANAVDEVIFTLPREYMATVEGMLPRLEAMGVTVRLSLDVYRPRASRTMFGYLGDDDPIPVVTYYRMTLDPTQLLLKRLLDVAGATVGLLVTAIAFPFVAYAVRRDSRGPIFFRQERVGQNGRRFYLYKFRTMQVDAEARKQELLVQNEMKGAIFKMSNDPRITRVGRFLRKASIDELPQFWNVLKGEMSLVGTRPPTPDEVAQYEEWHRGRISIKPGLTGVWQTSGRNRVDDFDQICQLDMAYIDNWSLGLDIKLLFKTVGVVVLGSGAR